jgi:nitrite reductase (NO-forming)
MPEDGMLKCVGERLLSFMRAAALPAALCTPWYTTYAEAQEAQTPAAAAPSSASVADEAVVPALPANLERLPAPAIAPPVNRKKPAAVHVELEARPVTGLLAEGIGYHYWTYNGTVPGPMIRVSQGDTVELTLYNALASPVSHSIDSHGVLGPGGGGKVTRLRPARRASSNSRRCGPGSLSITARRR